MGPFVPLKIKGIKMSDFEREMRARRVVVLFFAVVSGVSAVATAVMPAIVHA
jgi:hypothetical protein